MTRFLLGILGIVAVLPTTALAQLAPGVGYVFPAGGRAGTAVEVHLGGADWTPDVEFVVQDRRVRLEVLGRPGAVVMHEPPYWFDIKSFLNDPPLSREVKARFVLPADLPPGPVFWRAANANGAGNGGVFVVGTGPEVVEDEGRQQPQELAALPVTVNGRLRRIEEVDRYRIRAGRSGPVTCDLVARRLGSDFHGVLEVTDASGRQVAEAVDTEGVDPALTFFAEQGQSYTIAVRDLDYRGYRSLTYRLAVTPGPRVLAAVPAAGKRGEKRAVEFVGVGLATGQNRVERVTREVAFPKDPARKDFAYRLETPHGTAPDFHLLLSDLAEQAEAVDHRLTIPGAVTGTLHERGEKDTYTLTGKKGDVWEVTAQARCLGSRLDLTLSVLGPDGKELAANDDAAGTTDAHLAVTLPADGEYRVVVGDVSGQRTPPGAYRLVVDRPVPDFHLRLPPSLNIPVGGKAAFNVSVDRTGGFKEPVTLTLTGLPAGVTVPDNLVIPPTANALGITLKADAGAPAAASLVQVVGTATVGGRAAPRPATATWRGGLTSGDPEASHVPGFLVATTLKPPFKVKPVAADGGRRVHRGATYLADLVVERLDGFTGPITLDMAGTQSRHRQGIRGPAFVVAPQTTRVAYPVFLPEWLETTRTSRIALVAMAEVKDPKGTPRYVLAAMEGQITMSIEGALMKLSRGPEELVVPCGQTLEVPLKLARSAAVTDPVTVELLVPEPLTGLITAEPLTWPRDQESATLVVTTKVDPRLLGTWKLTARATSKREGHPVVSEVELEIEVTESGARPRASDTSPKRR